MSWRLNAPPIPKGGSGCYLDGTDFFVRRDPYTEKIEGQDLVDYCVHRF